jgi:hypothetical protein
MKSIAYALAMILGVAFANSAFAADVTMAKTKADCDKAGGMWTLRPKLARQGDGVSPSIRIRSPGQSPELFLSGPETIRL